MQLQLKKSEIPKKLLKYFKAKKPLPPKNLIGIPWRVALALQADGWILRQEIIWAKPAPMPEPVQDRCCKSHEHIFLFSKQPKYFFDHIAIQERSTNSESLNGRRKRNPDAFVQNGKKAEYREGFSKMEEGTVYENRNKRSVWTVASQGDSERHFAMFPEKLIRPCILAGTSAYGACKKCGTPWRRVLEKKRVATRPGKNTKVSKVDEGYLSVERSSIVGNRDPKRHTTKTKTMAWEQGCDCDCDEVVPCVVLDPFSGTATTAAAALKKNRRAIGIELSPEYIEISKRKIKRAMLRKGFGL